MIKVENIKDPFLIKSIITIPKLFELTGYTIRPENFEPNLGFLWLVAREKGRVIGLFEFRHYTNTTLEGHIYILPEFHTAGKSIPATEAIRHYLKDHTPYINVITIVPAECNHALKYCHKVGFQIQGKISNGIVYNDKLQDLIILQNKI